jgi:hypothetical protein
MMPGSAKRRFLMRLAAAGQALDALTPSAGVEAMTAFYADDRADGCDPDDGDTLLYQWGVNDWGDGPMLEVNVTRQFIPEADGEPRQLSLTFSFDPGAAPKGLRDGNRWCESPTGVAAFRKFVLGSRAMKAVGQQTPTKVELKYGRA